MPPKKNIIITADDFGCCNYIDRGITHGVDQGVVSCVSTFINFRKRDKNARGGAYSGSLKAITKLMNKKLKNNLGIPVGLHLTINAGLPILAADDIPNLIKRTAGNAPEYFKDINDFDPSLYVDNKVVRAQVKAEVEAQLNEYKKHFGHPNHISCHFGILFHFRKLLKEIISINGIERYPIRNPVLAYQSPNSRKDEDAVKSMKNYFRRKSEMKIEGFSKGVVWLIKHKGLIKEVIGSGAKSRVKLLQENKIKFPDYTIDYLYKRAGDFKTLQEPLNEMTNKVASCYNVSGRIPKSAVYEIIAHLGQGKEPDSGPIGVNKKYFASRSVELDRLIKHKDSLDSGLIKLVDYSILK